MASSAQSPLRERPIQFGKYTLLARIGSGGMGELFLARLRSAGGFEKLVVIKRILSHLTDKREIIDMFVAEARTAARIGHPNVCQIYELGQVDGRYYMALEYLEGLPLADVMVARKRAPQLADVRLLISLICQTAEGLHHAHSLREPDGGEGAQVVHRDVNPRNIFVTSAGVAKVLDFGIVKVRGALSQIQTDSVRGTYSYMAPEQLQGEPVDFTTDIFALGTITWEAVVGRRLFKRSSDLLTWRAIVEEPIPRPNQFRADLSPELDEAIMLALGRRPSDRFQSAREFAMALEQAIRPLGAPFTTLAVAAEMEKAFATELAMQRERVFAAHRRQEPGPAVVTRPAADSLPALSETLEDSFDGGNDTRVADPSYADLVTRMVRGRAQEVSVPDEVEDPPSEEIVLVGSLMPPTQDWRPVALPRPSRLPSPPPLPAYVVEEAPRMSETGDSPRPAIALTDPNDDEEMYRLRPRRRWVMVLALAVSAATGAAVVVVMNLGSGNEKSRGGTAPAEVAGSVVAASDPYTARSAAVSPTAAPTPIATAIPEETRSASPRAKPVAMASPGAGPDERRAHPGNDRTSTAPESPTVRDRDRHHERRERGAEVKRDRRPVKATAGARDKEPQKQHGAGRSHDPAKKRDVLADMLPQVTPVAPAKGAGFLTINTEPYATVYVNGKKLGFTPVVRLELAPGAHSLRLISSTGQPDKKVRVRIVAGQELRKFIKW